MAKDINRLNVVLAEKKRTGKWLAETIGKDPATVSKWCTNSSQAGIELLFKSQRFRRCMLKIYCGQPKSM